MLAEKECMTIKREWASKCESLQNEIDHWKNEHNAEQLKSAKLREQNSRTERELYRILQRKYELMRGNNVHSKSSNSLMTEDIKDIVPIIEEKQPVSLVLCL